ncbi:hypothetical protein D9M73_120160 [compost metagenome]
MLFEQGLGQRARDRILVFGSMTDEHAGQNSSPARWLARRGHDLSDPLLYRRVHIQILLCEEDSMGLADPVLGAGIPSQASGAD